MNANDMLELAKRNDGFMAAADDPVLIELAGTVSLTEIGDGYVLVRSMPTKSFPWRCGTRMLLHDQIGRWISPSAIPWDYSLKSLQSPCVMPHDS